MTQRLPRLRNNGVDGPNSLGVTLREFIEHEISALEKLLVEQFAHRDLALKLQAGEYERRLHDLNGEYKRDRERQADFVSMDKYEERIKAEALAREVALIRMDERFAEHVKRWEQRQREVDLLLQAHQTAADEATRATERATQASKDAAADAIRKSNRNIAVAGVFLTAVIVAMNLIGAI